MNKTYRKFTKSVVYTKEIDFPEIFRECEEIGCVSCAYKVESKSANENQRDCMHRRILQEIATYEN